MSNYHALPFDLGLTLIHPLDHRAQPTDLWRNQVEESCQSYNERLTRHSWRAHRRLLGVSVFRILVMYLLALLLVALFGGLDRLVATLHPLLLGGDHVCMECQSL